MHLMHNIKLNPGPDKVQGNKKPDNVKIAHFNICSLKCREHFIEVKQIVLENKIDIFTVSETWLDNSIPNLELEIPGFSIYHLDRQNKKGGGVCVYAQQTYKMELFKDISYICDSGFHQLWIKVQVRNLRSIILYHNYPKPVYITTRSFKRYAPDKFN